MTQPLLAALTVRARVPKSLSATLQDWESPIEIDAPITAWARSVVSVGSQVLMPLRLSVAGYLAPFP